MPTDCLPDSPDIDRLQDDATTLRDWVRAGVEGSLALVREHHPRCGDLAAGTSAALGFRLADAQLTIARHYDFASWAALRRYVLTVNRLTRSPHEQPVGTDLTDDDARADEVVRLACLNYGVDSPDRWERAEELLTAHPRLARRSIHVAAAAGDVEAVRLILATDADAATRDGGPFDWAPLLSLTYSRLPLGPGRDPLAVARLLLDAGADPASGYLWDGLPSPFTALTGVFGRGEQGAPPHPQELALARLLLEAGADANDSQTIYNRGLGDIARDDTEFLELLLDHGLGTGDGGRWRRLIAHGHQTPTEIVGDALQHAASAGLEQRIRLLLARVVDPALPGTHPAFGGRSPYENALLHGNIAVAELLAAAGADTTVADPLTPVIGALLAGDRAAVQQAMAGDDGLLGTVRAAHPDLTARAAELGRTEAVRLLAEYGFDLDHRARTTALHEAALRNDRATVELLLDLGADPTIHDSSYDSPPAGWARHAGHDDLARFIDAAPPPRSRRRGSERLHEGPLSPT